jgi:hypothetical protein
MIKKLAILLCLLQFGPFVFAQGDDYADFYASLGGHYTSLKELNRAIDTVNKYKLIDSADYEKTRAHLMFGFGYTYKKGYFETGASLHVGFGKSLVITGDNPYDADSTVYDWYAHQRILQLNGRLAVSPFHFLSTGADVGGVLSTFIHFKVEADSKPFSIFRYNGTRSLVPVISPFVNIHYADEDGYFFGAEPYVTFCMGQTSFKNVFPRSILPAGVSYSESMKMTFIGVRVWIGLSWIGE